MARPKPKHKLDLKSDAKPSAPTAADAASGANAVEDDKGWLRVKLSATLLDDAHFGSGSGGGGIDALVARDREGRPVIWASHLEGVRRDSASRLRGETVAAGFFGLPGGVQKQRAVFKSLYTTSTRETTVWRSTARKAFDNRAPRDDTLRGVEHVPKHTHFEGEAELPVTDLALLRRLLQEVDALGQGRSVGAGQVRLCLELATPKERRVIGAPPGRLMLLLRNLDPLCITATATPDNIIPTLAFIPGRAVLGALANWLIAEGNQDAAKTLVNGSVSVGDALPVPEVPDLLSKAEVAPAPLSLRSEKPTNEESPVPWWAGQRTDVQRVDSGDLATPRARRKRPEDDLFVYRAGSAGPWKAFRPSLRVRLRNGRSKPNQLAPDLFAIEQISEQTLFLCEIRGSNAVEMSRLAAALKPVLEGRRWLRIGRGGAPVEVAKAAWANAPARPKTPLTDARLTLTSDLLVRDDWLRWRASLDEAQFLAVAGKPPELSVSPIEQDSVTVHGFNGTSRLWRMPALAIRRGSVFRVTGKGVATLANMAAQGHWLGERTHEGFGRFRLDAGLPGVTPGGLVEAAVQSPPGDALEESVAKETHGWFEARRALAGGGNSEDPRPSLSQWRDLVTELAAELTANPDRKDSDAVSSRMDPKTAGKRSWLYNEALQILELLQAIPDACARASHARLFVRWLSANMRVERR